MENNPRYLFDTVSKIAYSMLTSSQLIHGKEKPIDLQTFQNILIQQVIVDKDNIKQVSNTKYLSTNKNELTLLINKFINDAHHLGIVYKYGLISFDRYKYITGKRRNIFFRSIRELKTK